MINSPTRANAHKETSMTIQTAISDSDRQTASAKDFNQKSTDIVKETTPSPVDEKNCESHDVREAVIDGSKKTYTYIKDHVARGARATDTAVHKYPYVGVAVGALIGVMAARMFSRNCK